MKLCYYSRSYVVAVSYLKFVVSMISYYIYNLYKLEFLYIFTYFFLQRT